MVVLRLFIPSVHTSNSSVCLLFFHQGTFWTSPQVRRELVWSDSGCQDHQSPEPEREGAAMIGWLMLNTKQNPGLAMLLRCQFSQTV